MVVVKIFITPLSKDQLDSFRKIGSQGSFFWGCALNFMSSWRESMVLCKGIVGPIVFKV